MEFSKKDWMGKNPPRLAQTNARKAIVRILNEENELTGIDPESIKVKESADSVESDMFVNVDIKVEMSPTLYIKEENESEDEVNTDTPFTFLETNEPINLPPEEALKSKGIVAKLAQKLNSKLNAVLTPQPTDSLLECLEPEVSVAVTSGDVHVCSCCSMTFSSLQPYEEHTRLCHLKHMYTSTDCDSSSAVFYTCEVCGKIFSQSWDLKQCLKQHYINNAQLRPYICVDCGEAFSTAVDLSAHQKNHALAGLFQCDNCEETFVSSDGLKCHMMSHFDYVCSICDEKFFVKDSLISHMETHTIDRCWMCVHCDRGFSSQEILVAHQRTHSIENSDRSGSCSKFNCERCGKSFVNKYKLEDHLQAHEDARLCELCYMVFPESILLKVHMQKQHKAEPPRYYRGSGRKGRYKCLPCNKYFQFVNSLKRHLHTVHSMAKPYQCRVCGECFRGAEQLKFHIQIHSMERATACPKCGEKFTKDDWALHFCSGENIFECLICGKCFSNNNNLQAHTKMHEEKRESGGASSSKDVQSCFQSDQIVFVDDAITIKRVSDMAKDSSAFRAAIANRLKGTGVFAQKKMEADNFKDRIARRLMGTGFVAQKRNEVMNFRDTIAERLKETGVLSFGNGNVSLSLLKVDRQNERL